MEIVIITIYYSPTNIMLYYTLQEPTTVSLGTRLSYSNKQRLVEKQDSFQYIPLIQNLTSFLQNSEVYAEVCNIT